MEIDNMLNNYSESHIVFIGLGCPRQEQWMFEDSSKIKAVMFGAGSAFDYHASAIKRNPVWMQNNGLDCLHRLASDPK